MVALVLTKKGKPVQGGKEKKGTKGKASKEGQPKKSLDAVVERKIDKQLLEKAVKALLKHHEAQTNEKEQLLGNDTTIQVHFTLEVAPGSASRKPFRVAIPHPIYKVSKEDAKSDDLAEPEVCLFVKDGSKAAVKEMIDQFPEQMGFVKKVMSLESLRKKYSQFSQRRALLKKYSVFMADDRILPMLTTSLGRDFLKAKKQPIPVNLSRQTSLPANILKSLSSTFLHLSEGTCVSVRAGYTNMTCQQLVDNISAICAGAVYKIPRHWANVRAIAIKTPTSMALPFYNKTPAELAEIARLAGVEQVWKDESGDQDMTDANDSKPADEEEVSSPKKRKEVKSPLIQALKKQKKMDNEPTDEVPTGIDTESSTKKQKKDSKKSAKVVDEEASDKPKMSKSKKEKVAKETKDVEVAGKKKKRESDGQVTTREESPKKKKSDDNDVKKDFVASKRFTGSKKGYVFRQGPQGLGYYIDIKPVVDKAALAALARMANQGRRKSEGHSKKGGRKSKGRRSY